MKYPDISWTHFIFDLFQIFKADQILYSKNTKILIRLADNPTDPVCPRMDQKDRSNRGDDLASKDFGQMKVNDSIMESPLMVYF